MVGYWRDAGVTPRPVDDVTDGVGNIIYESFDRGASMVHSIGVDNECTARNTKRGNGLC